MLKEFREFIARGNVVDLAVAVVIGAAFTAVVNSFANDVLMQVVAAIFGKANFDRLSFALNGTEIYYGLFLTALVSFLMVAVAVFFVVKAINSMQRFRQRRAAEEEATDAAPTELELLAEIRDALIARGGPRG